jgi:hypothetical protein
MNKIIQFPVQKTVPCLEEVEECKELLGTLDEELILARLRLCRALKQEREEIEAKEKGDPSAQLVLAEMRISESGRQTAIYRSIDWFDVIDRLIGRIGDLELQRAKMKIPEIRQMHMELRSQLERLARGQDVLEKPEERSRFAQSG